MEDVLTPKLLAFDEHYLDYTGALRAARALREQVDWVVLREHTCDSPYARGFFALLEALEIIPAGRRPTRSAPPRAGPPGAARLALRLLADRLRAGAGGLGLLELAVDVIPVEVAEEGLDVLAAAVRRRAEVGAYACSYTSIASTGTML